MQSTLLALNHYSDVIMSTTASQITDVSIVYSYVCSGADQRKHQWPCVTDLCQGNSPVTGEFPAQRASNAENVEELCKSEGFDSCDRPSDIA